MGKGGVAGNLGRVAPDLTGSSAPADAAALEGFQWRCMADPDGNEFDIDVVPIP